MSLNGAQQAEVSVTKALAAAANYAAEDVLSESASAGTAWTFSAVHPDNGGKGKIVKAVILWETTNLTPGIDLYLFSAAPTSNLNDNVANTALLYADEANYVGKIAFPALADLGGVSEAIATPSLATGNLPLHFQCGASANDLFGIAVLRDAVTGEAAGEDMVIKLTVEAA